jgi:hypothetical protein
MGRTTLQKLSGGLWERDPEAGEYLTDGFRLYWVVGIRVFNEETLVEIEDCRTLDVLLVSVDEINSLRRVHTPEAELTDTRDRASPWSPPGPDTGR